MADNEAQSYLRAYQYSNLLYRLRDQQKLEGAVAILKSARAEFEADWRHTSHAWYTTKRNNPEVMQLLQQSAGRASSPVSGTSRTLRLSTRLQRSKDNVDRHDALLYCDLKMEALFRTLEEMRLFKENKTLKKQVLERIAQGPDRASSKDRKKQSIKHAIRQHSKIPSLPKGMYGSLSASNKVGWDYSRRVVYLQDTTKLTQPEIEEIVWKEYLRDHSPKRGKKEFRRIFDLLEKDDPQGWQEIQSWSREERAAFDQWLDTHLSRVVEEDGEKNRPADAEETRHPVWSRLKRRLSQKHKALSPKLRPRKH